MSMRLGRRAPDAQTVWDILMWMSAHEELMETAYVLAEYATRALVNHAKSGETGMQAVKRLVQEGGAKEAETALASKMQSNGTGEELVRVLHERVQGLAREEAHAACSALPLSRRGRSWWDRVLDAYNGCTWLEMGLGQVMTEMQAHGEWTREDVQRWLGEDCRRWWPKLRLRGLFAMRRGRSPPQYLRSGDAAMKKP
jgi:hypothetical protein